MVNIVLASDATGLVCGEYYIKMKIINITYRFTGLDPGGKPPPNYFIHYYKFD